MQAGRVSRTVAEIHGTRIGAMPAFGAEAMNQQVAGREARGEARLVADQQAH